MGSLAIKVLLTTGMRQSSDKYRKKYRAVLMKSCFIQILSCYKRTCSRRN
ncbi:hypothetical protein UY3_04616 [Chelonia mydas]|uniref:Uncharacterized protein n=1 Tax=Chelonia mydas TaxID=8469 RepID=M7BLR9_CHEMY|nr:hypothetical protein UY3_04616 [Chelonia mydas]